MTDTAALPAKNTDEKQQARALGRAIWRSELTAHATTEQKKSSWSDDRRKYLSRAVKLLRNLEKEGLAISVTPKA